MAVAFTTAFIPPASCLNSLYITGTYSTHSYLLTLGPPASVQSQSCFPAGWKATAAFTFSPALSCPGGFSTVSSTTRAIPNSPAETVALCCPNGYVAAAMPEGYFAGQLCSRAVAQAGTIVVTSVNEVALTSSTQTITVNTFDGINAYGVKIAHRANDVSTSTSVASSTTATPATTATDSLAGVTTTPSSVAVDTSSGGLSTGAKAGIGVGVAVGALLIIALIAALLFRRRRRNHAADVAAMNGTNGSPAQHPGSGQTQYANPAPYQGDMTQHSAYDANGAMYQQGGYNANGTPVHEGQGYGWNNGKVAPNQHYSPPPAPPAELPNTATMAPVEMEGSQAQHR